MALYVIADLHLSLNTGHPMDVFGARWRGYTEKLCRNWRETVQPEDTVIIPGDISWAMHLADAREDFALLDSLPGQKYLGKGNHDFWWETAAKMQRFFDENGFSTLHLLYNNAALVEDRIICGTRGWFLEENQQLTVGTVDYKKIVNRELQRLAISLNAAKSLQSGENTAREILVFLHFPPAWGGFICREFLEMLAAANVKRCYYGHIHGVYNVPPTRMVNGISLTLAAADFLDFKPLYIAPTPI